MLPLRTIVLLTVLGYVCGQQCSHTSPCAFTGGEAYTAPNEVSSAGGTLTITLTAQMADVTIEWLTLHRRTLNGGFPAPTWRIKRGDTVTVNLVNSLELPQKEQAINQFRYPNTTNLHTHGLHISSKEPQDNVFVHVHPGETYQYVYQIDSENPAGTYWYHPHLHGSTIFQVHSGMAGMIIVEDPTTGNAAMPQHLADVSCPNNCEHEVVLLFQPTLQYINNANRGFANIQQQIEDNDLFRHNQYTTSNGQTLEAWLTSETNGIDHFTTNGKLWPTLSITAGQVKRFRMVNAGGSATLELIITNSGTTTAASGCAVKEISFDGVYLDEARYQRLDNKTILAPSSKGDWLVVCNTPGSYELRSVPDQGDSDSLGNFQRYRGRLLLITVTGSAATTSIGTALPIRESFVQDFRSLTQDQVSGRFVVEANPGTRLNRERFSSETNYRFKGKLGTVQEWYLTNTDTNLGHPIHIHINHFQIISYNPYTGPIGATNRNNFVLYSQDEDICYHQHAGYVTGTTANIPNNALRYLGHDTRATTGGAGTLGYVVPGEFRDVLIVPPLANITIRMMLHKFVGEVVIHCHILSHEDSGMMMTVEVVEADGDTTANIPSGTAYPGQCAKCDPYPFNDANVLCSAGWIPRAKSITSWLLCAMALLFLCLF